MEKINRKTILWLLILILAIGGIVFKDNITFFIKSRYILSRSSMENVYGWKEYVDTCYYDEENADIKSCESDKTLFNLIENGYRDLILSKENYNCNDFIGESSEFLLGFFEYTGGSKYDPYHLDADHDGWPCESLKI